MATIRLRRVPPDRAEEARRPRADEQRVERSNALGLLQALHLAQAWELNQQALCTLLGTVPRTLQRWKNQAEQERALPLSADTRERLSYLLGIWKALTILFPTPANRKAWLEHANADPLFNGQAPLKRMLQGRVADLYTVRRYLDAARG